MAEADMIERFDGLDRFSGLRNALREMARKTGHWAGIPMPLDGQPLVIEPRFPTAKIFERVKDEAPTDDNDLELVNSWYSPEKRGNVLVIRDKSTGKACAGYEPRIHGLKFILGTIGASDAWGIEQEGRAVQTLGSLLRHHIFKQYLMTGMFLESSKRSGVMYVFRRLRPTIALSMRGESARILACLCMHPIGYYDRTWAGAMCPTDDVIAHLMLMRGDEHMFWKRCNQHSSLVPEAGL